MYDSIIMAKSEHKAREERLLRHFNGVVEKPVGRSLINLPIGNLLDRLPKINLQNARTMEPETVNVRSTGEWRQASMS